MGGLGWFLVGLFIGANLGVIVMAIFVAAGRENYHPYREGSE
jgi:biotin transporter BioY